MHHFDPIVRSKGNLLFLQKKESLEIYLIETQNIGCSRVVAFDRFAVTMIFSVKLERYDKPDHHARVTQLTLMGDVR